MNIFKNKEFLLSLLLLVIIAVISVGTYERWWDWRISLEYFYLTHWLAWVGMGYVAVFTPIYVFLKRYRKGSYKTLMKVHVFGNLIAFLLISVHFSQQIGRPAAFAPLHSTGLILYTFMTLVVITGFLQRFGLIYQLRNSWRYIHSSLISAFYIVIVIHILQFYNVV